MPRRVALAYLPSFPCLTTRMPARLFPSQCGSRTFSHPLLRPSTSDFRRARSRPVAPPSTTANRPVRSRSFGVASTQVVRICWHSCCKSFFSLHFFLPTLPVHAEKDEAKRIISTKKDQDSSTSARGRADIRLFASGVTQGDS